MSTLAFIPATSPAQIEQARELFLEYHSALDFSLCFEGFDKEVASLPGDYAPPDGRLFLAEYEGQLVGCVALRKLEPGICEMKRLYLRPLVRGKGQGRVLTEFLIAEARQMGYTRLRLDTFEAKMPDAVALYRKLGFREIPPYNNKSLPGTLFMELAL